MLAIMNGGFSVDDLVFLIVERYRVKSRSKYEVTCG